MMGDVLPAATLAAGNSKREKKNANCELLGNVQYICHG